MEITPHGYSTKFVELVFYIFCAMAGPTRGIKITETEVYLQLRVHSHAHAHADIETSLLVTLNAAIHPGQFGTNVCNYLFEVSD